MIKEFLINLQRSLRANMSAFFNQTEYTDLKKQKIIDETCDLLNKISISGKSNRKKTHKIFSKKVYDLIKNKELLNFLQKSFIQQMFFIHNRIYLLKYLLEMRSSKNWSFWKKIIKESSIGNPIRYFLYPKSSGNKIFQAYHLKKYNEFIKINLKDFNEIIEFGGGYGNMASIFSQINPNSKYTIFDTYEVNLLQYYYLKRLNLKVNFNSLNKNSKNINLINSIKILKKKISNIKKNNNLLIANWSLSETPLNFRKKIFFLIDKFDYQLISFQENFENVDNLKYFHALEKYNQKKLRDTKLFPIKKMKNHYYLFSSKIK